MNMTKAAKELYITQPALSHALSKMEDELGLKLVYRDGNRLVLTEEGRKLQKDFEGIVRAYDDMNLHAAKMPRGAGGKDHPGLCGGDHGLFLPVYLRHSLRFPRHQHPEDLRGTRDHRQYAAERADRFCHHLPPFDGAQHRKPYAHPGPHHAGRGGGDTPF